MSGNKNKKRVARPVGPVLEPHQVVLRPLVTEKGVHFSETDRRYSFEVNPLADKVAIRHAVEVLFDVKVESVATQNRSGKQRRYRFRTGKTKNWKKAIVKLKPDNRIELF